MAMHGHGGSLSEESPYSIPSHKLTMWLFIISDAVTFGAILFAYGYLRVATPDWQTPFNYESIINVATMKFVLITSSLSMLGAVLDSKGGGKHTVLLIICSDQFM